MKKLLFLSIIILLEIVGIFSISNNPFTSPAFADNHEVEKKAPGQKCDRNEKDCATGYICNADNHESVGDRFETCIKDAPVAADKKGCRADEYSEEDILNPAPRYSKCDVDLECKGGTCKKLPKAEEGDACEYDSSSKKRNRTKDEVKKVCGDGLKCDEKTRKCKKDASLSNKCLNDKNTGSGEGKTECKGDTTSAHGNFREGEICCGDFQCVGKGGKVEGDGPRVCVNRLKNAFCKTDGEEAEGDATTTKEVLDADQKCCGGLRHIDGKCVKEVACIEDGECKVGSFKCCGEKSCYKATNDKGVTDKVAKCHEGLAPPPSPPCAEGSFKDGKCGAVPTAFGKISTDPEGFIKSMFALLLSLSGGVALLLIMKSGYLIMTANGKPEAIQSGRDQLIAAIVGLIFLIFSFVILQVIGIEILKIPENKIAP